MGVNGIGNSSSIYTGYTSSQTNMFDLSQQLRTASNKANYNYGTNTSSLSVKQQGSAIDFKNAALGVQQAVSEMLGKKNDNSTVFGGYSANSSNSDVLTATYDKNIGKYSSEALEARRNPNYVAPEPKDTAIMATQLATTQVNKGEALSTSGKELSDGTYRFEIEQGGKTTSFAFVAEKGDTNGAVQEKMAKAINDKNIGVTAKVEYDKQKGTSQLVLESKKTGESAEFAARDVAGYSAVSEMGVSGRTQQAQNAVYYEGEVDKQLSTGNNVVLKGEATRKESESNDIKVNDRTNVSLKKTSEDYTKISYSKDTLSGINAARELVNAYNGLFDAAKSNQDNVHSQRLMKQLSSAAESYGGKLYGIGIDRDENGYLTIDEDKMKKAAESGKIEDFFSTEQEGGNYGFANRINSLSKSVSENPAQYIGEKSAQSGTEDGYDFWEEDTSNVIPNYSQLYFKMQQYENMGSLFSSLF